MKKVVIDLSASPLLGTAAKSVWLIQGYLDQGYHLTIVNKNWSRDMPVTGMVYDSERDKYGEASWTQLWDPSTHPYDFFENLVVPSFENITFEQSQDINLFGKVRRIFRTLFDPWYISNHDFVIMQMSKRERREYRKQKINDFLGGDLVPTVLGLLYFFAQFYVTRRFKVYSHASAFRFKLAPHLYTNAVREYISEAKNKNMKYVLLSVLWDEDKKFERREFLRGGPRFDPDIFSDLVRYVAELDKKALTDGRFRVLLASKKAVDWEHVLKSNYLDLRSFEELGFCLSQSLFIAQELSVATINWPSTYSIWITNCADIQHLTWMDDRDTSPWARNDIHQRPVTELLDLIGVL